MIGTEGLEHIVKLAILSAYLKGERPVSVLISAKVESGKTEIIKKASICRGILYLNEATAMGIQKHYLQDIIDRKIRTIIIPDLMVPFAKQFSTVQTFVAFLNGLLEEGQVGISTAFVHIVLPSEARCNVITSTTRADLSRQLQSWLKFGFISRFLPITYEYSTSSVLKIMQSIALREYQKEHKFNLVAPREDTTIELPVDISLQVKTLTAVLSKDLDNYGFRLQRQLQTLCMASALFNKRTKVEQVDYDIISKLSDHINLKYRQI